MNNKAVKFQKAIGIAYMVAGVAKFVPGVEDVGLLLRQCAEANAGSFVAGPSDWLAANPFFVTVLVAIAMFGSGLVQFLDRGLVRLASACQIPMLFCFVGIIHRFKPEIFVIDAFFLFAAVFIIVKKTQRMREAGGGAGNEAPGS